jgi:hypothetical protein
VAWFEPYALPELPRFVRAASYLLPVPEGWLRASVYQDRRSGRERLVLEPLAHASEPAPPLGLLQEQALIDRLPLEPAGPTQRAWRDAATALAARAAGRALVLGPDEPAAADAETLRLLELGAAA